MYIYRERDEKNFLIKSKLQNFRSHPGKVLQLCS